MEDATVWILTGVLTVVSGALAYFLKRIPEKLEDVSRSVSRMATEVARIYVMLENGERRMERLESRTQRHTEKIDRLEERVAGFPDRRNGHG